jgi:hypothetical protein
MRLASFTIKVAAAYGSASDQTEFVWNLPRKDEQAFQSSADARLAAQCVANRTVQSE